MMMKIIIIIIISLKVGSELAVWLLLTSLRDGICENIRLSALRNNATLDVELVTAIEPDHLNMSMWHG